MSAPDDDTLRRLLAGLRHGPVYITGGRCDGDSRAVEAFCDIIRVAPALAAEVLRLRAERDVAISRRSYDARDVAPTPEEIIAHESRGGLWLILSVGRRYHVMQVTRHTLAMDVMPHKWIALDADFMPCVWPVGGAP